MTVLLRSPLLWLALVAITVSGCSLLEDRLGGSGRDGDDRFPDVLEVELRPAGERVYDVAVTLSSPYDTPERYADGWRVLAPDGTVLGTHTLMHDHANEQPFTRTMRGLHIPAGIDTVTVEGRDQANGFGGRTVSIEVPD